MNQEESDLLPERPALDPTAERALFRRAADGMLEEREFRALESRLATDGSLRARYVRFMGLEASLPEILESVSSGVRSVQNRPVRAGRYRVVVAALAACVTALSLLAAGLLEWR